VTDLEHWEILESTYEVKNQFVKLRQDKCRLPDGRVIDDFYVVEEPDYSMVFALTPENQVVMVEQYKHGIQEVVYELPAGYFEPDGAPAVEQARRELIEETGYDVPQLIQVSTHISHPTRMTNRMYLFAGVNAKRIAAQSLDENEEIRVHLFELHTVMQMLDSGEINAVQTVAGIYHALAVLKRQGLV
jgi:ADP-ribose pyrophosphatase